MKKTYVLDTSVLLTDHKSISSFGSNDIIIPLIVLEELDRHKKRTDGVGTNARGVIRALDELREKGSLHNGIKIKKNSGILFVKTAIPEQLPIGLDLSIPDNQIIGTALTEQQLNPSKKVTVVSCDINMRIKCDAIGLLTEGYTSDKIVKDYSEIYTGFVSLVVDEQVINSFYNNEDVFITQKDANKQNIILYCNQFVMLISNSNSKKTALTRWKGNLEPIKKIKEHEDLWGVVAKNKEQSFALDLLMDSSVELVTLSGAAGSGKSLLTIAAGLQQVMAPATKNNNGDRTRKYSRLIISRPIMPMGKDIGFLPGTVLEKLEPWLAPIEDNLRYLFANDHLMLSQYIEKGIIEVSALTYIRGRSIQNAFIIIDEAQSLTKHEVKTILTRAGNDSKIVLNGDTAQIDGPHVDETSNGLTVAIEKFKEYDFTGHITLTKGERSHLATVASQIL